MTSMPKVAWKYIQMSQGTEERKESNFPWKVCDSHCGEDYISAQFDVGVEMGNLWEGVPAEGMGACVCHEHTEWALMSQVEQNIVFLTIHSLWS